MRKTNKIILITLVVFILLLGIGYAAIQNITLNISGTAAADPNQANFKVRFVGTPIVSDNVYAVAEITGDTTANINVNSLSKKGDSVTVSYTVQNESTDISADLLVETTNSNIEYFTIKSMLEKEYLTAGEETTVTVVVELSKTPIKESVSAIIGTQLIAVPVQPGKEGTSEEIKGSSQTPEEDLGTTIGDITNDHIGDYIDLGNNIVGTESTSDDWRILYKDGNTVYAILADCLPNGTGHAKSAGLNISKSDTEDYVYNVNSKTDRDSLLAGLTHSTAWNDLANGIFGATVTGAPTVELFINSYNTKNGTELGYTTIPIVLDKGTEDYNLYLPHTKIVDECQGYWFASPYSTRGVAVWNATFSGGVNIANYNYTLNGVRPVVSLPFDITCTYTDGVWIVD